MTREKKQLEGLFQAWRAGDALRAVAFFTEGATYREARGTTLTGRDAIRAHFTRFFRDGPHWRFDAEEAIVEGDRAAVGYLFAVEGPGGAWTERAGCALVRFEGGAVAEWREYEA